MTKCKKCGAETGGGRAKYCPTCRTAHLSAVKRKGAWSDEELAYLKTHYSGAQRRKAREIGAALGKPEHRVRAKACELGLTRPRKIINWSKAEDDRLMEMAGQRSCATIARKMGRSLSSIWRRLAYLGVSGRIREGYTQTELGMCLGVSRRTLDRWAREGKLAVRRRGDVWQVTDSAVVAFIRKYPYEIDLRNVEQTWFMDLIFDAARRAA